MPIFVKKHLYWSVQRQLMRSLYEAEAIETVIFSGVHMDRKALKMSINDKEAELRMVYIPAHLLKSLIEMAEKHLVEFSHRTEHEDLSERQTDVEIARAVLADRH